MSMTRSFMQEALRLAERGRGLTSPNPTVGAVVVRDGRSWGAGFHTWAGVDHAEIVALREAGEAARGSTRLCHPRTVLASWPNRPCVEALIQAGVARVVAAMQDPNPQVSGEGFGGFAKRESKLPVDEAHTRRSRTPERAFIHFMKTGRPLVTMKAALTLDGKIAAPAGQRRLDHQRNRARGRAAGPAFFRRDSDRPGHGSRRRLPAHRPLRARAQPAAAAHRARFAACAFRSLRRWSRARRAMFWWWAPRPRLRERRKALEAAGIQVLIADGQGGRTDPRKVIEYLAQRALSVADGGSRQQGELDDARHANRGQDSVLLRAERSWAA